MKSEIESMKAEIERLSQRLAILEVGKDTGADGEGVAAGDNGGANEAQVIPQQKLRAFDVTCDGRENDPWLIYLPTGCISYAGFEPDEIDPAPDATTRLANLGTAIKNGGIYAHLYLELDDDSDSDSSTEPEIVGFQKLEIDTTPALTPTEDNIKIVNIKIATITDGAISQNVSSSLILGGGESGGKNKDVGCYYITRTPPEDSESEGSVGFGNCYVQIAGKLYAGPSTSFSKSALASKFLAIDAAVSSPSGGTTFQMRTFASVNSLKTAQEDPDHLIIPLYKFAADGSVECDFRTVPYEYQMNYN